MADEEQAAPSNSLRTAASASVTQPLVPFRIELPAPFTGEGVEPFSSWIQRFEVALDVSTAQLDKPKLLAARLSGPAFAYWQSLPALVKSNYEQAKARLSAVFGRTSFLATFQTHLTARPRKPQEPLEVYAADLTNLVAEAFPQYGIEAQSCEIFRRFVTGLDPSLQLKIHEHGAVTLDAALKVATQCERAQLALTVAAHTPIMPVTVTPQPGACSQSPISELTAAIADLKTELNDLKQTHLRHTESRLDRLSQQVAEFHRGSAACTHPMRPPCAADIHNYPRGQSTVQDGVHHHGCVDCCVTSSHNPARGRRPLRDDFSPPRHRPLASDWTAYSSYDDVSTPLRQPQRSRHYDTHHRRADYYEDCSPPRRRRDRYSARSPSQERYSNTSHYPSHIPRPRRARSPSPASQITRAQHSYSSPPSAQHNRPDHIRHSSPSRQVHFSTPHHTETPTTTHSQGNY